MLFLFSFLATIRVQFLLLKTVALSRSSLGCCCSCDLLDPNHRRLLRPHLPTTRAGNHVLSGLERGLSHHSSGYRKKKSSIRDPKRLQASNTSAFGIESLNTNQTQSLGRSTEYPSGISHGQLQLKLSHFTIRSAKMPSYQVQPVPSPVRTTTDSTTTTTTSRTFSYDSSNSTTPLTPSSPTNPGSATGAHSRNGSYFGGLHVSKRSSSGNNNNNTTKPHTASASDNRRTTHDHTRSFSDSSTTTGGRLSALFPRSKSRSPSRPFSSTSNSQSSTANKRHGADYYSSAAAADHDLDTEGRGQMISPLASPTLDGSFSPPMSPRSVSSMGNPGHHHHHQQRYSTVGARTSDDGHGLHYTTTTTTGGTPLVVRTTSADATHSASVRHVNDNDDEGYYYCPRRGMTRNQHLFKGVSISRTIAGLVGTGSGGGGRRGGGGWKEGELKKGACVFI